MKKFNNYFAGGLKIQSFLGLPSTLAMVTVSAVSILFFAGSLRAADRHVLNGHVPPAAANSVSAGSLSSTNHLRLAIGLPLRNKEGLTNLLQQIYDLKGTNFHHYLTPKQFADQFGPTDDDYAALVAFAESHGLRITDTHPNKMLVDVEGAVSDIENAFQIKMRLYQHPKENRTFYAPDTEPSVPAELSVLDISGLSNYKLPHPNYVLAATNSSAKVTPQAGSGQGGNYLGKDFRAAYAPGVTLTGTGQVVGLLQFDGYLQSDITQYETLAGLPNVTLQNVLLDGYNGVPSGNGGEVEVSLDIEMTISMAPGVSKIILYEAGPFGTPNDILNRMATDDEASQISSSWGWSGGPQSTTEQIFLQMDAQGQTFFNAAGDGDAFLPGQVDDPNFTGSPSSSPNITVVGGTTLTTTGPVGSYVSETVWQWGFDAGSSGGISSFYSIPIWQQGISMANNQGSTTHRNIPDVALTADNVLVIADNGTFYPGTGGTSCASPLWAAFTALVNQQAKANGQQTVGFINPVIYSIATGTSYNSAFHDITIGNNTNSGSPSAFFAVQGYDLCTGLGTPNGSNIINILAPPTSVPVISVLTNIVVGGNGNGIIDPNECNSLFIVITNIGFTNATSVQAELSTSTPGVTVSQASAAFPNIPLGGSATNLTPFQISTTPSFLCGSTIFFTLVLKTDEATITKVFTVNTGIPGVPLRFDNSLPATVATGNSSVNSIITVSNIASTLMHVTVSAFEYDPAATDSTLTLSLIAPDGTTVALSKNNGTSSQSYGSDCSDADRTTFDDGAASSIDTATAPFIGTFIPDSALSVFNGKSGTNLNGTWQLQASNTFSGTLATIQCWSLILTPAQCTDGGGQCPGVDLSLGMVAQPNPVFVQSNLTYTLTVTNNGPDTATQVGLSQTLPPNVTFISATSPQGTCSQSGGVVSCNLGTMIVGQTATMTVVVAPTVIGTIFSSAAVTSAEQELNPANNSATVETVVNARSADLSVVLSANPSPVLLNGLLNYTAVVHNGGPSAATNVVVSNVVPANASLISTSTTQGSIVTSANSIIANLGTLAVGSNAIVSIQVRPLVLGVITATSVVSSGLSDPAPANNTSTVNTTVTAASDLALTLTGPASAIIGSNYTYQLTVQNFGPSAATGVNLRDTLPAGLSYIMAASLQGIVSVSNNVVSCLVSNLAVGATASMSVTVGTSNLLGVAPITVVDTASVTATQADPNSTNNTASLSTFITFPTISVVNAGYLLQAESFVPTNGMIDAGETVTMLLKLQNLGNIDTANNLTATLLATGGVSLSHGPQVENYGTLSAGAAATARPFTFTAVATNGGTLTLSLQLQNGGTNLSVVTFSFPMPVTNSFANTNNIIIPDHGPGTPYPSTNLVSGVTGLVGKITVTLTNVNHTFPDDIDLLLVSPSGQTVLFMSHTGDGGILTNTSITFDQSATNADGSVKYLPTSSQIVSGSYAPTQNGTVSFATNAPAGPYGTNLSVFNGTNANGVWKLFVFDSSPGDQGIIIGGWSLGITSGSEINPVVDLAVTGKVAPNPVLAGANLTYTFSVTNNGPNPATTIQFTNVLPTNSVFVSATNSAHVPSATNGNGAMFCTLTNLSVGTSITVTVIVAPTAAGTLTSVATVTGSDSDPFQANNSATVISTATAPVADLGVSVTGPTNGIVGSNLVYNVTITNNGPGTAVSVALNDILPGAFNFVSGVSSGTLGNPFVTNGAVVCNLGNIAFGSTAIVSLVVNASQAATYTNTVSASTTSTDGNSTNNSASIVTVINNPAPNIVAYGVRLLSGSSNGSLIPGQTATVSFQLANTGSADTANLTATLLAANGVGSPSGAQNYGAVIHGGSAVARTFSFTPSGTNSGSVTAILQLVDGTNNLGSISFSFNLPATNQFANTARIIIPDHGAGSPYPSIITISNLTGVVSKVTASLSNLSHQFPNDIEILLVSPSGQSVVLMSGVGGDQSMTNVTLNFDDSASSSLPASSQFSTAITSGTYLATDDGLGLPFPSPAPASPYGTALSAFNGGNPNGNWVLYVFDNLAGDSGSIGGGWSLNVTTISPVNSAADLGISLIQPPASYPNNAFNFTVNVTNKGPATATNVIVTDTLPAGVNFIGASISSYTVSGSVLTFNLGNLNNNSVTNFTITASAASTGLYMDNASVTSDQVDLLPQDNSAQAVVQILRSPSLGATAGKTNGLFALTISLTGAPGIYNILASTNLATPLSNWTVLATVTNTGSNYRFTDTNASGFHSRYYRAVLLP